MTMITFIARKNGLVLWSLGDYQYQIEGYNYKDTFKADFDEALAKFNALTDK